ncbi:MAG: class I SAM-dependent methyltransferase [Chloroflexota bacterium]
MASGGKQQGPILAAVGANVTVFDNSAAQLAQDELVSKREGLSIRTVQGDMRNLSVFADESFDLYLSPGFQYLHRRFARSGRSAIGCCGRVADY